nr:hypothetical protein [Tanacetum cinerariifolium]
MRTRRSYFPITTNVTIPKRQRKQISNVVETELRTMANNQVFDNRTIAQMLQAPIEGYEDDIIVPPINANNFELKQTLINLVQSNKFTGASINLKLLSIWKKLRLSSLNDTKMVLELADRTISKRTGVAENVQSSSTVDTRETFLSTTHAIINVHEREIILKQDKQSLTLNCGDTPSISKYKFQSLSKIDLIDAGVGKSALEEIENFLNDDSIPIGIENFMFNMEEDILFLERLLSEDPCPLLPMNPNQTKSSTKEPEDSFIMGYEHFNTTLVMDLDQVVESSIKNLVPIPCECEVTSDNEIESDNPVKDDYSVFTTFLNLLFSDSDDVTSNDKESIHDVPIEKIKIDYPDEFSGELAHIDPEIPESDFDFEQEIRLIENLLYDYSSSRPSEEHNAKEQPIKREHAEYISRMEMIMILKREVIDIVTNTDDVLPPGVEKDDDSEGEIDTVEELHVDNSIFNSENVLSDNEESNFDNPSVPLPPPKPPDVKPDSEEEISVVMNTIDKLECLNQKDVIDVSTNDDDVYSSFLFVIRMFLPFLICSKVFSFLLFAESEDPSLTLVSPFRASGFSLGWNFHVLL